MHRLTSAALAAAAIAAPAIASHTAQPAKTEPAETISGDAQPERQPLPLQALSHAAPITSIDPANEDFSDLKAIGDRIGEARVVVLGEQSHQEGPVFLAKARLIKYLHQELGFDVLAFESGMIHAMDVGRALAGNDATIEEALSRGIFPVWGQSAQCQPTFEYVRASATTDRPITLVGFDAQPTSRIADQQIRDIIESSYALAGFDLPAEALMAVIDELATIRTGPSVELFESLSPKFEALASQIADDRDRAEDRSVKLELARRSADDLGWYMRMAAKQMTGRPMEEWADTINERDERMGANLVWLANEYYRGRKVIVWAATRHMVHKQKEIAYPAKPGFYDNMDSAGETAFAELGDDLYTIGFTAGGGQIGSLFRDDLYPIEPPIEGSIEEAAQRLTADLGSPFLFIDFAGLPADHALRQPQTMRPLGYAWQEAIWPDQMDAVIYIDQHFKSDQDVFAPDDYELTIN